MRKFNYLFNSFFASPRKWKWAFLGLIWSLIGSAQAQTTLRFYTVGNSVTDAINFSGLKSMAESRGNTHIWGRQMIPGAPLNWLWEHPNDGFTEQPFGYPNNAFPNYTWDAISLQPFDRQIEGSGNDKEMITNYINLAKGKSPNCQFYVYMRWPRTPDGKQPTDATLTADTWTNLWGRTFTGGWDNTNETKDFFEKLLLAVRGANATNKPALIIPVGEVFNSLNNKMKNGQVSGYNRIWQVYSDGIHMNNVGSYIAATTFYATIYKADPRGMSVPSEYGSISSGLASIIQSTVWEIVSSYQYSGVGASVAVTSVSVSPATLSLSVGSSGNLTATVSPSNATNKGVSWSSSNTAVATVDATGRVTAQAAGSATITATTADGNRTATATVNVSAGSSAGLNYQYYTGSFDVLPNFSTLTPVSTGTVANFDISPRTQNDLFAFRFTGTINIATAGTYTFFTTSDDGSKLFINGTQVVNNDGLHGAVEQSGTINLTAGSHQIEVTFFEKTGGEVLEVRYQGPGIAKQLIPSSILGGQGVAVTSVSLNTTSGSVMIGKNIQLTATVSPANATNKNVTWSSSNTAVATVDANGRVTGVSAGTATITVRTSDGGRTATFAATVFANSKPSAVLNVSATSGAAPLAVSFNANGSTDPNPGDFILGYEWDFGDGSPKNFNVSPSYTYNTAGTYTVTLRVMDNNDLYSDPVTRQITVTNGGSTTSPSGTLATWDFAAAGGQSTVAAGARNADVSAASATLGSGLSAINYLTNGLTASNQNFADQSGALGGNDFISFSVTPASGKSLTIDKVDIRPVSQNATRTFALFSSVRGFTSGNQIAVFTASANLGAALTSINITGHANLTSAVEFRVYIYGQTNIYEAAGFGNRGSGSGVDLAVYGSSANASAASVTPATSTPVGATGTVIREFWSNVSGTSVSNIPLTTAASGSDILSSLEGPTNWADNYGSRIRGFVIPSTSGSYTFYVAGDDNTELYLSTNDNPANKTRIAFVSGWTNSREWAKYTEQRSTAVSLSAGVKYYIEVLHKEGTGGDNVAVGWTGPGISAITVIGGSNIAPFTETTSSGAPVGFTYCSDEGQTCNVTGTADVAYGANGVFTYKTGVTGACPCNNANFGDPIPGVAKKCYVRTNTSGGTVDTQAPSVPTGLTSSNITQTSFTLSWNASTDNVGVTGYEVFRNGTSVGTTNGSTRTLNVTGLTAGVNYSMTVRARDAVGNVSAASTALSVTTQSATNNPPTGTPKLPIGMNLPSLNYYSSGIMFTDAMTTASEMFTFTEGGPWNTEQINNIPRNANGWPTQIPFNVGGGAQLVRFLINNFYSGRYVVLYDGVGRIRVNGIPNSVVNGRTVIDFNGQGGHVWIDILESQSGNPIRNMRVLPEQYANGGTYPTFLPKFLDGIRPFHALRFMDWINTNNSTQRNWSDRITKTYYSQGTGRGISLEYAIELCNTLGVDGWFCVPHLATDDYMRNMARLLRDNLASGRKIYIEFSNEVWNWQFSQAGWIVNNAPGSTDTYVMNDLAALGAAGSNHPEKDAYMFARMFKIFKAEFTGANASRLVKIAPVQHGWYDNTRRVLQYLKNVNEQCDMVSPAGYFSFETADHNVWVTQCSAVTAKQVVAAASARFDETSGLWTQKNAEYAQQFGVGYAVYEGGQHMQPYEQKDWCYNDAVWDAQIHPDMYELYMKNFRKHVEPTVNCRIFMAFSYMGERRSRYGSWGHLESLAQVGGVNGNYMTIAPKYQALLDANAPKTSTRFGRPTSEISSKEDVITIYPNPAKEEIRIAGLAETSTVEIYGFDGRLYIKKDVSYDGAVSIIDLPIGVYVVKVTNSQQGTEIHKIIKE